MSNWIITDSYPYLDDVPIPNPTTITRTVSHVGVADDQFYNDGYPYLIGLRPPMPYVPPVKQKTYISVFRQQRNRL